MNFDIKTEQLGDDAYLISLTGEVDLYTAPEFKKELLDAISQGAKQVIVDFSETTFIDSTTLGPALSTGRHPCSKIHLALRGRARPAANRPTSGTVANSSPCP